MNNNASVNPLSVNTSVANIVLDAFEDNFLLGILGPICIYSPLIITICILMFSALSSSVDKAMWFILWLIVSTCIRSIGVMAMPKTKIQQDVTVSLCKSNLHKYIPNDVTYSTFVLTFSLFYFITPLIMTSAQSNIFALNLHVLAFFIAYIALDIGVKHSIGCITGLFYSVGIEFITGGALGGFFSGLVMYGINNKKQLFITEVNSNKEVCTTPSKQKFKCSVYKNGELVAYQ